MGFQEITWALQSYLEPALSKIGYRLFVQRAVEQGAYGVGLALPKTTTGTTYSLPQFLPFQNKKGDETNVINKTSLLGTTCAVEWEFIAREDDD